MEECALYIYLYIYIHTYIKVNGKEYQAHPAIDQTAYMDAWKEYHTTAGTILPEVEHLDDRNMSKLL